MASRPARILIVDDDPLLAASIGAPLRNAGHCVHSITSPRDPELAEQCAQASLIILDLALPGRSGFDILQELRQRHETRFKPVLMLTAHDPMAYRLRGLALGADDFLLKPPNHEELVLRVAALLRRTGDMEGSEHVVAFRGGAKERIDPRDILFVRAARNYCYLHTRRGRLLASDSMSGLTGTLGERFVRTHRSYMVNKAHVAAARWADKSTYVLEIDNPERDVVPVSRAYRRPVRAALGLD